VEGFEFGIRTKIVFGKGRFEGSVKQFISSDPTRVLVVVDRHFEWVGRDLAPRSTLYIHDGKEPSFELASDLFRLARGCTRIVGIGGGSVIDLAKVAALAPTNPGELADHITGIRSTNSFENSPVPFMAVPTTAGSGSEVTWVSVLTRAGRKIFINGDSMFPSVAVVDPELTYTLTPEQSAVSGIDAFSHLVECYISTHSNTLTEAFCEKGLALAVNNLVNARNGKEEARDAMCQASLLGGLATRAETVLGHSIGYAITSRKPIAHGIAVGVSLPYVLGYNLPSIKAEKLRTLGRIMLGEAQSEEGFERLLLYRLLKILAELGLPVSLRELTIDHSDLPAMADECVSSYPRLANPKPYDRAAVELILEKMYSGSPFFYQTGVSDNKLRP